MEEFEKADICNRLRILFVSFCTPEFYKMCAIPIRKVESIKKGCRDGIPFLRYMYSVVLVEFQDRHEGTLRNFYRTDLAHSLLTLFLLLEELSLT